MNSVCEPVSGRQNVTRPHAAQARKEFLFCAMLAVWANSLAFSLDSVTKPVAYSSPSSVYLDWSPSPDINVLGYRLLRTPTDATGDPEGAAIPLFETAITETEYKDSSVAPGAYYRYQVETLRAGMDSTVSEASEPVCGQYLTVFIPDVIVTDSNSLSYGTAHPGNPANGRIQIPVSTQCAYELSAAGIDIVVQLPNDLVIADDNEGEGVLVELGGITAGLPYSVSAMDGILRFASASADGRSLYGTGVLFYIYVQPRGPLGSCPQEDNMLLVPEEQDGGVSFYDINDLFHPIDSLLLDDGWLCLGGNNCILGDADEDGDVDLNDVQRILDLQTLKSIPSVCTPNSCDINHDRRVDSADAVLVRRWLSGKSLSLDANAKDTSGKSFANYGEGEAVTPEITVSSITGDPGANGIVELTIDAGSKPLPLAGFDAVISFPAGAKGLTFVNAQPGPAWPSQKVSASVCERTSEESGSVMLSVGAEDTLECTGKTVLATFSFTIAPDADPATTYPILLQNFREHDAFGMTPGHGAPGQAKGIVQGALMAAITDSQSGLPINNASVRVSSVRASRSGSRGYYIAQPLEDGQYTLSISAPGYAKATQSATLQGAAQQIVPVQLTPVSPEEGDDDEGDKESSGSCGTAETESPNAALLAFGTSIMLLSILHAARRFGGQ